MQTFLPDWDPTKVALILDSRRKFKQVVECMELYNAICKGAGYGHHPATKMWRATPDALLEYGMCMLRQCLADGVNSIDSSLWYGYHYRGRPKAWPVWWGDEAIAASHRSNLLRKDPIYYGQFGWTEPDDLPYIWPV